MAENFGNSLQENLPLSQDTFCSLWDMINLPDKATMLADIDAVDMASSEAILVPTVQPQVQPHGAHVPSSRSSLPSTCNWPGTHDFKLLFGHQEKINKHITWTYSETDNKLYVQKDAVCPFSFQTNTIMSNGTILRAMAVYTSPKHATEVVTRCVNHSQQEIIQGVPEAEHIIRSDSQSACYEVDAETKRHSVVLPFENPPIGQNYSTYIFKFACFNSCAGGPNRRPLTLVFTLEEITSQTVLGRITLDLKICACPGRDRDLAEKEKMPRLTNPGPALKKVKTEAINISVPHEFFENFPKKKSQEKTKRGEEFIIRVKDRECYNFLNDMKKLYQTSKRVGRLSPECKSILRIYKSSSDEDEKS